MTTKDYLKNNKPRISLLLVSVFFISTLLSSFYDGFYHILLLFPQDIKNVSAWYKVLTYPFYINGVLRWLHSGIVIILAGYIIEHRLSRNKVIVLIALCSIIGGIIYSAVNVNNPVNTPLGSPAMITWGLSSCAFILIIKKIKTSILFEKILAGLFIVSLISMEFIDYGFLMGQIGVIFFGLLYGLIFDEEKLSPFSTSLDSH